MTQKIQIISILLLLGIAAMVYTLSLQPPQDFPIGEKFPVEEGESLYSVSERLEQQHIVSSALLFRGWLSTIGQDKKISLGVYEFDEKASLGAVVAKMVKGPDAPLLSVTIPEGFTTKEIADAFKKVLPSFSPDRFGALVHAGKLDGYLFPSTYYPLPSYTEQDVIDLMTETFDKEYAKHFKTATFPPRVTSVREVLSLAAILEGEAKTPEDMKIVSGILQKRLQQGMRLQVDVSEVTYKESGLPDQPINNPGIIALTAVFDPTPSPYLYYLTGKDGTMHYAKTFEEHSRNIKNYLR